MEQVSTSCVQDTARGLSSNFSGKSECIPDDHFRSACSTLLRMFDLLIGEDPSNWPWTAYINLPILPFSLILIPNQSLALSVGLPMTLALARIPLWPWFILLRQSIPGSCLRPSYSTCIRLAQALRSAGICLAGVRSLPDKVRFSIILQLALTRVEAVPKVELRRVRWCRW